MRHLNTRAGSRLRAAFRPALVPLEARKLLSDLPLNGIGQEAAIQPPPPPNITVEPAPEPYNPYWDAFKVGFADGFTGVVSYGTYTYSSGFVAPPQTTAPTTP